MFAQNEALPDSTENRGVYDLDDLTSHLFSALLCLVFWNNKVEQYAYESSEADATDGEVTKSKLSTANTQSKDERYNDEIACIAKVNLILYKAIYTY